MTRPVDPEYDVVVVGSGVAGLATALGLAGLRRVAIVTGGSLRSGSTTWAQGGLAAAIADDDSSELHSTDTAVAGADFGNPAAIRILTEAAPLQLAELLRAGARLDRAANDRLALTREGGHSRRRVAHAGGDASGAEVSRALVATIQASDVDVLEHTSVTDLLTDGSGAVTGVAIRRADGTTATVTARAVVLATGGAGGLFESTTNPPEVTGAGLGLALRAGATLADLEFVQFHPTALRVASAGHQVPLVTEALRGEGAVLRDERGRPVMSGRHPLGDLAPRDIVARRIDELIERGDRVWLDATQVASVTDRFPTVVASCRSYGVNPATEPIPIAPTQHFMCGGVRTDRWGTTDVPGLYAVGEVAATGVHGANRLASNSLVEGLVFGRRIAARLALDLPQRIQHGSHTTMARPAAIAADSLAQLRGVVSHAAGIRRGGVRLGQAVETLQTSGSTSDEWLAALAIVTAAAARQESRGCHWRSDHPATSEWWRQRRVLIRLGGDGLPTASIQDRTHEDTSDLGRTA